MQSLLARERFASRSIVEQKAALNLAQFAQQVPDLDIDGDRVEALVGALIVSFSSFSLGSPPPRTRI